MKFLIIEDEPTAARRLARMLTELRPEAEILGPLDSVEAAIGFLRNGSPADLIFLDIHLADGSSFEIFKEVEVDVPVVFATAYDEYALKAFQLDSIAYLLKPFKKKELTSAIEKFEKRNQKPPLIDYERLAEAVMQKENALQKRLIIRYGRKIKAIEIAEVAYFFIESKVTMLRMNDGKEYPVDQNLDQLESMLDPQRFFRVNRQLIVCIDAITQMYSHTKSRVEIELKPIFGGKRIVSADRSPHFKQWLKG